MHGAATPHIATRRLLRVAAFAIFLCCWWLTAHFAIVSPFLLPSPANVAIAALRLGMDGTLWHHALISIRRVMLGFALSAVLGIVAAVLLAVQPRLRDMLDPPLEFLRQIPPLALLPLLILWLGIGEAQKIGVIVLSCFFPIFLGTLDGLVRTNRNLVEVGVVCCLPRAAILWRVILPDAAPSIVTGLRIGLGYSWRALVGAELIAASAGLGYMIEDAQTLARTDIVLVGVLVIGILGMIAEWLARLAVRRFVPWARIDIGLAGD